MFRILTFSLLFFLLSCSTNSNSVGEQNSSSSTNKPQSSFWDGENSLLRGMAFGNGVWSNAEPDPSLHNETDYADLQSLGLNAIRFYLSYKYFEDDNAPYQYKQSGWDWLDTNLSWARRHGIKLFLNIHYPQGGFQSNGDGGALWDDMENQNRLTAFWHAIADRYKNDTLIAAYDLLNEPVVTKNNLQWQTLAQRLVDTIRAVDTNHFITVERVNGKVGGDYSNDDVLNFVFVNDPAKKYGLTFHIYSPIEYTHQYADWTSFANSDGGTYPDSSAMQFSSEQWIEASSDNPKVPKGNSDWEFYEGNWKVASDTAKANMARPIMQCKNAGEGTVWFDSLVVEEKNPNGEVKKIAEYDLPSKSGWYFWTEKEGGSVEEIGENAGGESGSVKISGTVSDANYASSQMYFVMKQGYSYRASGKMKGESVPSDAECKIRIDFAKGENITFRDRAYLENEIKKYLAVAEARGLPIYLGEFGVIKYTFEKDKGGLRWVDDMISILRENGVSFTYHAWYDDYFGVRDNPLLKELFGSKFRSRGK